MSYLDLPRIHFTGQFLAAPSTINNTPNNYDSANWTPEATELYWGPNNNGVVDLFQCTVSDVVGDGLGSDPLCGGPVAAVYAGAPPMLVDLDPMQQNSSEIWGLLLQIGDAGGAFVRGTFEPVAFNDIWINAKSSSAPRSSASGSAVYGSTLENLVWNPGGSPALARLRDLSPKALSIHLVMSAHNNNPQIYSFNEATFAALAREGVPQDVLDRIEPLQGYIQNVGDTAGDIPTSSYVNFQLNLLLGEQDAKRWRDTILLGTEQTYTPSTPHEYNYGLLLGTVGPKAAGEPLFVVPARTLAPLSASADGSRDASFAPAKLRAADHALTLDLGNSLPVELPGDPPSTARLGQLSLAYEDPIGSGTYVPLVDNIPYDPASGLLTRRAGVLDVPLNEGETAAVARRPLVLLGTPGGGEQTVILRENAQGLSLRANQFIYRMNPDRPTTPSFPRGNTADVELYVRKFGETAGTEGMTIALTLLSEQQAKAYTTSTPGTSGTRGINEPGVALSVPQDALSFNATATVDASGVARCRLKATNPGNPRGHVDGQVYFLTYDFSPPVPGYLGDPNNVVSVQIYQHTTVTGTPSWDNGIGEILRQYGYMYPVMAAFGLGEHDEVKKNHAIIRQVLTRDLRDPLSMPAVRDLSESRRQLIVAWIDAGMP